MNLKQLFRDSLTVKISLVLSLVVTLLTALASYVIVSREAQAMEALTLERARMAAISGASAYGRMLEDGVDNGYIKVGDLFSDDYEIIKGYAWGKNPRYHTRYDFYTDARAPLLQETYMSSEDMLYAVGTDTKGYVPTHNIRYQLPVTGDEAKDLAGNRSKRFFKDAVPMAAVQSLAPYLVQDYVRDTGQKAFHVSAPITVKGKHWGAFRMGVAKDSVEQLKFDLSITLLGIFLGFVIVTTGVIAVMVRRSIQPLVELTQLADDISTGEKLDQPVKARTTDEVGRMAKSVERLRASLKAAMSRLGE